MFHAREGISLCVEWPEVDVEVKGVVVLLDEARFENPIVDGRDDNTICKHIGEGESM